MCDRKGWGMANLNRILGMASKVIDKQMQKRGQGTPQQPSQQGGTDWRDVVRTAADKLTGDDRGRQQGAPQYGQPQQYAPQQAVGQQRGPVDA
ncbi:hypothetical protein, partial [Paraburkholderia sp. BR14264]|uniref:hypothetical protein n=1 Tax=Paraburkholderia sp. BR14264 TaxID=3237001 RepID=UPI00397A976E